MGILWVNQAQVINGSIFNDANINNASFFDGAKIYGGTFNRLKLFNVIFKASFNCPADIPDDIQSMKIASPQTAFDRAWNTRIDDIQGKANTVTWPNCQAEGCFYEDGAILTGLPPYLRDMIRPIAEMGLPPVAAP